MRQQQQQRPAACAGGRARRLLGRLALASFAPKAVDAGCQIGRPSSEVCVLSDSQTMEYELRWHHGWQWFLLHTNGAAAVTAGLVLQRGWSKYYPRTGFVLMDSNSGMPPATLDPTAPAYDPRTYASHDHPVGVRRKFIYESASGIRPLTDWKVLTIGIDTNASAESPQDVQVPLSSVLIGLRCHETLWVKPGFPGCRMSLTATLLPFELSHSVHIAAPMARGDSHVYRVTVGDYDSLNISLTRDVMNRTDSPARGLVGAAMLNLGKWSPPFTLEFPYNLSRSPPGTDLEVHAPETQAMQAYTYQQLRADKGLLNLRGCASGLAGCRQQYFPKATNTGADVELEKQGLLKSHLWARALGDSGRSFASLDEGTLDTHVERLCAGPGAEGTYYLTLYADAELSGDGRLSASADGFDAADDQDNAWPGVDTFGWWVTQANFGCHCCGADAALPHGTCGGDVDPVQYPTHHLCNVGNNVGELCVGKLMPPASMRVVRGYAMRVTLLAFASGAVPGDVTMLGCVSYGQWRRYRVKTAGSADAQLRVALSQIGSGGAVGVNVGGLYAAADRPPTESDYDLKATYPMSSLTLTPCDVTVATEWHFAVHLGPRTSNGGVLETLFELALNTTSALAPLGVGSLTEGTSCCGGTTNWLVPHVPDDRALSVNLTLHSGAVHAVLLQYDSCPRYTPGDLYQSCNGLCEVGWVTRWDAITGARHSANQFTLTVPMGETITESDKRRAGNWYVGVRALPGEAAAFTLSLSLAAPKPLKAKPYCSGVLDRFCRSQTQRYAPGALPLTTAGEARPVGIILSSAAAAHGGRHAAAPPMAMGIAAVAAALTLRAGRRSRARP